MKINFTKLGLFISLCLLCNIGVHAQNENGKSRIIVIGAHPDDCDSDAGGTAALLAAMGMPSNLWPSRMAMPVITSSKGNNWLNAVTKKHRK
jgi:hypothetical protein